MFIDAVVYETSLKIAVEIRFLVAAYKYVLKRILPEVQSLQARNMHSRIRARERSSTTLRRE